MRTKALISNSIEQRSGEQRMPNRAASNRRRRWLKWLLPAFAVFLALTVWLLADWRTQRADDQKLAAAARALKQGQWREAEELGEQLSRSRRLYREGLLVAGEAAARLDRPVESLAYYAAIPDDGSRLAQASQLAQAELFLEALPRLSAAEALYRRVLELSPEELIAHERLAYLLGLQGRSWEAIPHRLELLRQGRSIPIHMALLGLGDAADENPESVELFYRADLDDAAALLAMARVALRQERLTDAQRWLEQSLARRPEQWRGQAWRGQLLVTAANWDGYERWLRELPEAAGDYPEIWHVRAQAALARDDIGGAVRCSWEVLRRDPNHQPATYTLGRALQASGEESSAQPFFERSKKLQQLLIAVRTYQISQPQSAIESACRLTNELGLYWECWGWYQLLAKSRELTAVDQAARDQALERARRDPQSRTAVEQRLAERYDFAAYPLPVERGSNGATADIARTNALANTIQFSNETAAVGINFIYRNGSQPETAGEYMYEFSGGSASVLDFDLDGRPDLYLAQGTDWPPREENMRYLDCLYRNRGAGRWEDVARQAGIRENRFSQGVAVGDYDNDGFPDLYVGNIGANRLYHNNGDGTFSDVSTSAAAQPGDVSGQDWTTSCLLADLNGDGLPDIYAVNYLVGETLFSQPCLMPDGSPRLCTPHEFAAAQDRLYLNLGDGRFRDVTATSGVQVPDGKGLGVVAGDFDGSGRLSLFVANDTVPNFLFVNQTDRPGADPRFSEQGFLAGVAVDADGHSQACMGVALGDSNEDQRLDIFVTNFRNESNTLYRQLESLLFRDDTRTANLRAASFDLLGFGTQFLDADLDGRQDLVVTNGHVGDLRAHGVLYQMPPQFFHNQGAGRFRELSANTLGKFFAGKYLGRGLARWDYDADGRPDFVVNHLGEAAAIVRNTTRVPYHYVAIELRGVGSSRDAIGASVTVTAERSGGESHAYWQQLTAGDGYMSSNERQLLFGVGDCTNISSVEVRWPSGTRSRLKNVEVDRTWIVVEGQDEAQVKPRW